MLRLQIFGAIDEIEEGVLLLHEHAVFAPLLAHFVAAANVGDGEGYAAVEQRQPRAGKRGRRAEAIRAIAVEQQRARAIAREALAIHDRNGNLDAVARGCTFWSGWILLGMGYRLRSRHSPIRRTG